MTTVRYTAGVFGGFVLSVTADPLAGVIFLGVAWFGAKTYSNSDTSNTGRKVMDRDNATIERVYDNDK